MLHEGFDHEMNADHIYSLSEAFSCLVAAKTMDACLVDPAVGDVGYLDDSGLDVLRDIVVEFVASGHVYVLAHKRELCVAGMDH